MRDRARAGAIVAALLLVAACAEYLGTSFSEIAPPEIAGPKIEPGARCALDAVNGAAPGAPWRVSRQHRIRVQGWAVDAASMSTSEWLVVELAGGGRRFYAVTWARARRDDVAQAIGQGPSLARAGFELIGTLQQLPPGTYDIGVVLGGPSGLVSCATGRQLVAV